MEHGTTTLIVLKELAGNPLPHLNTIQKFLLPHVPFLTMFWISVWITTAFVLLIKLWYEYKEYKRGGDN